MSTGQVQLTSSSVASLWTTYMNDSLAVCTTSHFLSNVQDDEVRKIVEKAYRLSTRHLEEIRSFFAKKDIATPIGLTDQDVNPAAPQLFTDPFYLFYIANMTYFGMNAYSLALNHSARKDIRNFFSDCMRESIDLFNALTDTLLDKGLFIRAPLLAVTKEADFVKKPSFLAGIFSVPRSLQTIELSHIFNNIIRNTIGLPLITGFAQVARSETVREYLLRGMEVSATHTKEFRTILENEQIPLPSTPHAFVTDSTEAPFSDKLMLYHISVMNAGAIGNYGIAIATSLRFDLHATYLRLAAELSRYALEGVNIMIDNGWMEQPPQVIDHELLARV